MKTLAKNLRKFAKELRKHGGSQVKPQPIPNPTASLAKGDLGSLDAGPKPKNEFVPDFPKPKFGKKLFDVGELT